MAGKGGNATQFRARNERIALEVLRRSGEATKAEIAVAAGVTPAAAAAIVESLTEAGFIKHVGKRFGERGSPASLHRLNPDRLGAIGIWIGRRRLSAALVDCSGAIRFREDHAHAWPEPAAVERIANATIARLVAQVPAGMILAGVGVAAPYFLGAWAHELDLPAGVPSGLAQAWEERPLVTLLSGPGPDAVLIENDASAAALAELTFGAPPQMADFLLVTLGTLVGGGLVLSGRLNTGARGNAAALGPLPVSPSRLRPAETGQTRLLHRASLNALHRHLQAAGLPAAQCADLSSLPPDAAPLVAEWAADCADALAEAIEAIASILDLGAVIIDGGLPADLRRLLVDQTRASFEARMPEGLIGPGILAGSLGQDGPLLGAACLPLARLLDLDNGLPLAGMSGVSAGRAYP